MKLLTKAILKAFEKQGDTGEKSSEDIKVIVKFFGGGQARWYAVEYNPETEVFFGYVSLFNDPACDGLGYFSLGELEEIRFPPFNLPIGRDMYFGEHTLKEIMDGERP